MDAAAAKGEAPAWVDAQKRTFTAWANLQLAQRGMEINDVSTDFVDSVKFINLVEVLSGKSVGKYSTKAKVATGTGTTKGRQGLLHARHNLDLAFSLLQAEGMHFVNQGPVDIIAMNQNVTMGVVWSLIKKYHLVSIAAGNAASGDGNAASGEQRAPTDRSARKDLLDWINYMIGKKTLVNKEVKNFTTDWVDGTCLLALCNECHRSAAQASSFTIDFMGGGSDQMRVKQGLKIAHDKLNVPKILSPNDIGVDEFSMITYLTYFKQMYHDAKSVRPNDNALIEGGREAHQHASEKFTVGETE